MADIENDKELDELDVPSEDGGVEEAVEAEKRSNRDVYLDRMRSRFPDVDFEDEEARYGAYLGYDDDLNDRYGRLEESDRKMKELFGRDPRFMDMMYDISVRGEDAPVSFARHFGDMMEEDLRDPDVAKRVAEANRERIQAKAREEEESERLRAEHDQNLEESGRVISAFAEEHELSDEEMGELVDLFVRISDEGLTGKIREETLDLLRKGKQYDADVSAAESRGLVDGRNERISLERRREGGDGLPHVHGAVNNPEVDVPVERPLRRKSMYEIK